LTRSNQTSTQRQAVRQHFRRLRNSLSRSQQKNAARDLVRTLERSGLLLRHQHVALYLANDGEINPAHVLQRLLKRGVHCYLPVLHPLYRGRLHFSRVTPDTGYRANRYGIAEPCLSQRQLMNPAFLSLVLLPLVAFDERGNRMGMGGGYYDRSFAFKHRGSAPTPVMIGLAHECQKAAALQTESWDLPLDGIVTDRRFYRCR
jgi:5-formyltetrahydrofolate cyclo-ligase